MNKLLVILISIVLISCNKNTVNKNDVEDITIDEERQVERNNEVRKSGDIQDFDSIILDTFICYQQKLPSIDSIKFIAYLNLQDPLFGNLPKEIDQLRNLKGIYIGTNSKMTELPKEIGRLKNLEVLSFVKAFKLKTIPDEICSLENLRVLQIAWGGIITEIPDSIGKLEKLEMLILARNKITKLPESISKLQNLKVLDIWDNDINKEEYNRIKGLLPNTEIYYYSPYGY